MPLILCIGWQGGIVPNMTHLIRRQSASTSENAYTQNQYAPMRVFVTYIYADIKVPHSPFDCGVNRWITATEIETGFH